MSCRVLLAAAGDEPPPCVDVRGEGQALARMRNWRKGRDSNPRTRLPQLLV